MNTVNIYVGIDTHKHQHTAAVITPVGETLNVAGFEATGDGYRQLVAWVTTLGSPIRVGVEGTGSYGAGITRHLLDCGFDVREVNRPNRQHRRRYGKSDPADAVGAARAVASGQATGTPRCLNGPIEATRNLQVARRSAVKARTAIINQLHALIVTAPNELREHLQQLTTKQLVDHVTKQTPTSIEDPTDAVIIAMASLGAIYVTLCEQIKHLTSHLDTIVAAAAPTGLMEQTGIGTIIAADLLITAGTNPDRLTSEAAFAALCGVSPVDASSGQQLRHRLNRGGDRQANAALYRAVIVRLRYHQPTKDYMTKRLAQGKTKKETIRCLKRYLARDIHHILTTRHL